MSCNSRKDIFKFLRSWFQSSAKSEASHVIAGGGTGVALTDERSGQGQRSNQQAARATLPVQITSVEFQISLNPPGISFEWREMVFAVFTIVPRSLSILVSVGTTTGRVFKRSPSGTRREGNIDSAPLCGLFPPTRGQHVFIITSV